MAGQKAIGTVPRPQSDPDRGGRHGAERHRLPFDPIAAAARSWDERWPERARMEAVTSLMRVHQLVITELDERLRPLELTFARFEVLVLLSFSAAGRCRWARSANACRCTPPR